jgi:hypothetical protein
MPWAEVQYEEVKINDSRLESYLTTLRKLYANGQVLLYCFQPVDIAIFDEAQHQDRQGFEYLLASFMNNPSVVANLEDIKLRTKTVSLPKHDILSSFEMEGSLTHLLLRGGAYINFPHEEEARKLSRAFMESLGHDHSQVFRITGAWTYWFFDIAWDTTFIVFNSVQRKWWWLCMTDTD